MSPASVFITGAAAGIGRQTALAFARRGYIVGAYDVDDVGVRALAQEIGESGGRAIPGKLDVRDANAFEAAIKQFATEAGGLTVLINNAGVLLGGSFVEHSAADYQRMVDINVSGVINGCLAAYDELRSTPGATVVNLCSASAIYGQAELAVYSATKFAVRGLTEALEIEWAGQGIRVRAIWPLFVRTAMTKDLATGTVSTLGIRLTTDDVVEQILAACEPSTPDRLLRRVHYAVGLQAHLVSAGARFSPAWLTRAVNKRLARH